MALPRYASVCHSSKLCLVPALPQGLFPLHSRSNPKGQLLLAFEIHQRIFNYRCCLGCQMIQKAHQTKCFSIDVAARRKDKSLFFHFKTLVDCEYRSVSGRAVNFFFFFFRLLCVCRDWQSKIRSKSTTCACVCEKKNLEGPLIPLTFPPFAD